MSQAGAIADPAAAGKYTRILDAALTLFHRYGVRRTSIDDVAQEAGVAKGTVYLYFDSKETLFFEVAERLFAEVWARMNAAEADKGPFVHRLVVLLDMLNRPVKVKVEARHIGPLAVEG